MRNVTNYSEVRRACPPPVEGSRTLDRFKFLIPLLAFVLLAGFMWYGLYLNPRELPSVLIDKPVPEFSLETLGDNQPIAKQDLPDEVFLLNFWGSYCLPCLVEHPTLTRLSEDKVIPIVGVNYKDREDYALDWLETQGNPFRFSIMDPLGRLGIDMGVSGAPETFLIDANKVIRYRHVGVVDERAWAEVLLPVIEDLRRSGS